MSTLETAAGKPLSTTIEPLDDHGSAVRFETQCVVIPDLAHRSRRPRVVTKSYTLPLWKRRTSSPCPTSVPPEDVFPEENQSHVVLRVPLPTLSLKPYSTARTTDHTPLPPCLVHRPHSGPSCPSTPSLVRHIRTSRKASPSPSRTDIVTVPLRPCCTACESITEAALVGGDAWPEHFSRAASRRRSTSVDGSPRTITVAGSAASASYGALGVSINVDEIDKRRRSSDSTTSRKAPSDNATAKEESRVPFICQITASSSSAPDTCPPSSPTRIAPATSRIPEEQDDEDENENELFPLPSPKRTPTTSPAPSPAGSLSSLMAVQANHSRATSPTPSTCSGDFPGAHSSKRQFLEPPPCASSSSLSLPKLSESTTDLTLNEDPPRAPSPNLLSTLPSLSGRLGSQSPSPRISFVPPTPTDTLSSATNNVSKVPQSPEPVSVAASTAMPSTRSPSQSSTSLHSPTHKRFSWRFKRSVSADVTSLIPSSATHSCSPSASPTSSPSSNVRKSFSMSSSRHVIADMLRGVGAIGSSGIGPGM
ncbi:hypothetical protein V8E55_001293 [Tylopilus felleus]